MFKKIFILMALTAFLSVCGGGGSSAAASSSGSSSSSSSSGGAAQGYQVQEKIQAVD